MSRFHILALLFALSLSNPAVIRAADKPVVDGGARTVVYDIAGLIHRPGGRTGYDRIDEVARRIVSTVHEGGWGGEKEGESRLRELNGAKLEITTTAKHHKEIVELLAALRGRLDIDVNLRADLFEIDRAVFEKEIQRELKRRPAAEVEETVVALLRKKGTLVVANALPIANRREAQPLSVRQAFTFIEKAQAGEKKQVNEYGLGFQGVSFRVTPEISPDRRFVSLKIAQKTTELLELKKRQVYPPLSEELVTIEVPDLAETTATATVVVSDGSWALAAVGYRSPAAKAKDRVLVLALHATIYIEEEDKERRNNPK